MIKEERRKDLPIIRVMTGIRNMGYTLESAILDIVDNSIVAGAKKVNIIMVLVRKWGDWLETS